MYHKHVMLLPYTTTLGMEAIVEDTNLATPCSGSYIWSSELNATQQPLLIAKKFAALKSTDDGLQVSLSDGDLLAFPDNHEKWRWQCIMALNHLMNFLFSTIAPLMSDK
ncbi:unnamed protein product [Musa acuminata var. zebrina]